MQGQWLGEANFVFWCHLANYLAELFACYRRLEKLLLHFRDKFDLDQPVNCVAHV